MKPKILSEKIVYQSSLTKIIATKVKMTNGKVVNWEYIDHANGVGVLPIDKDGNVYLCKEWRPAWKDYVLQIPAGTCIARDEKGRIKQVHNELREEIGMDTKKIEKLASFMVSGKINYMPHVYLANDLFPSYKDPDEDEVLEVIKIPFDKAYERFVSGKIPTTSYTLIAFLMAKEKLFSN